MTSKNSRTYKTSWVRSSTNKKGGKAFILYYIGELFFRIAKPGRRFLLLRSSLFSLWVNFLRKSKTKRPGNRPLSLVY
jgi:hypothetical protein